MNSLRIHCLLIAFALMSSCSRAPQPGSTAGEPAAPASPAVQGRYVKTTTTTETSGWKALDFKPDGTVVVNDDMTGTFRIEKGNIIVQGGAMTFVGKSSGEDLVFDGETYKKQK
jgi:hypothetical protein